MSTIVATPTCPTKAVYSDGQITVFVKSGQMLRFPTTITPRLSAATPEQLSSMELLPLTIHWPSIDEDLSIESLIESGFAS